MNLHTLLRQFDPSLILEGIASVQIRGVQEDSRLIRPGDLFIARPGTQTDGRRFIADAESRGAVAAVVPTRVDSSALPQIVVADAAAAASILGHLFHRRPTDRLKLIGITGTNGKTTTAWLLRQLLNSTGRKCGLIGTVEVDDGRRRRQADLTTPGAVETAELLAAMRDNDCHAAVMEVSSHALHQKRVDGATFAAAAFTNLTGDHLDYHQTMESYASAKARLFEMLPPSAVAVVSGDDPWSEHMIRNCPARVVRFGLTSPKPDPSDHPPPDYCAQDIAVTPQAAHFILVTPDGRAEVNMRLIGRHNIENAIAAAAIAGEAFGLSVHQIAAALRDAQAAPGRLQCLPSELPFTVLVDYAHTDDALENVLATLRPITPGALRVLFGCGGDRDPSKRPRMARIAQQYADAIYVTSDNPRTESPLAIINDILDGFAADTSNAVVVEPDRRAAIERILADARPGDVVLLAGKGHENYQIIGTEKRHFDDVEEARKILRTTTMA